MTTERSVLLFLRAPQRGRVKTRLAADLGEAAALALYRAFVADTLATLARGGYGVQVCFTPPAARRAVRQWLGSGYSLRPQRGEDLGDRMREAFRAAFARGFEAALLVGSDCPDLPGGFLEEAFMALAGHDAVLGPARDGGYYLIGFRRETFLPEAFAGIPWGTPGVCGLTLERFREGGRRVHLLPPWQDVDTVADLADLSVRSVGTSFAGSATVACLNRLGSLPVRGKGVRPEEDRSSAGGEGGPG